jgi:hypothetical protein
MKISRSLAESINNLAKLLSPEQSISNVSTDDKIMVYDSYDNTYKAISVYDVVTNLNLVRLEQLVDGSTDINYNNLTNLPDDKISILYDNPNFTYSGFVITWGDKSFLHKGKQYTISGSSVNLSSIVTSPENKTFYCYIQYDLTNDMYTFKFYNTRQPVTENSLEVATINTNSTTISSINYKRYFYYINGYSISDISDKNVIPITNQNGYIDASFLPPTIGIYRYHDRTPISANSHKDYVLSSIFPQLNSSEFTRVRVQVYALDNVIGSSTYNMYVYQDTASITAISSDYSMVTIYNISDTSMTFDVNIIV